MTLKELLAKKNQLATDMRALHEKAQTEERGFTSDEKEQWDKMTKDMEDLDAQIERQRTLDDINLDEPVNPLPGETRDPDEPAEPRSEEQRDQEYSAAFERMIRSTEPGMTGLSAEDRSLLQLRGFTPEEMRAQGVATDAAGGYTVPEGFGDRLIENMLAFGGVAQEATPFETEDGATIPFATNDDTGNVGAILAENTQDTEQDLTFGTVSLTAYMYTSKIVRVAYQLLQDSAFDIDGLLARKLGERIGRATAAHFATGTGSGQPEGITVGAGAGATAAAAAAISFDDLVDLEHSVDPAYRQFGAKFLFNDTTLKLLKKTADSEGRPLWLPGVGSEVPATIYGYEYRIDQGMPNVATTNVSVVFGLLSEYYVRRVQEILLLRLVERYADFLQVGFLAFARFDGKVMDSGAIKKLTHP